ncbi:MAG: sugar phosphate nucleotidyltransferase [Candidatus Thorarchaeota archaeon]
MLPQKNKYKDGIISIILCAGKGTRISDFDQNLPKPLIKIDEKPILFHLIFNLIRSNITSIIIITGHLNEEIEKYILKFKEENESLRDKITLINAKPDYKKGPLYSFLSITRGDNLLHKDKIYVVLPGDTYFEFELFDVIMKIVQENFTSIMDNSLIFYQIFEEAALRNTLSASKVISVIKTRKEKSRELLEEIQTKYISEIKNQQIIQQIIPIFAFNYDTILKLIEAEKLMKVSTIREVLNYILKRGWIINAMALQSNYQFYDIDTKSDLLKLQKRERNNRRSDYSEKN